MDILNMRGSIRMLGRRFGGSIKSNSLSLPKARLKNGKVFTDCEKVFRRFSVPANHSTTMELASNEEAHQVV
eukprot:766583-Hanusia_phi.AAC.5